MKKVDFNKPLILLNGTESEVNLSKTLASIIASGTKNDPLKYIGWALKLEALQVLELDESDVETLKGFIKAHEQMTDLLKYRLLECFN